MTRRALAAPDWPIDLAPASPLLLRLTYRYAGRDFRLTDVHGEVVRDILA
jgi:hypothetical protein